MLLRFLASRVSMLLLCVNLGAAVAATHPCLISQTRIAALAAGTTEWTTMKNYCDDNLTTLIGPDYAGWGWRTAVENYSTAYQVLRTSDPATANKYAAKALAIMKVLARHHNYGGPSPTAQLLGLGNGVNKSFLLPFSPMSGTTITLYKVPAKDTSLVYNGDTATLSHFDPIVKISTTQGGASAYGASDYKLNYRDGLTIYVLRWLTANHPANGATYYVTMASDTGATLPAGQIAVSGTTVTLSAAPSNTEAIFAGFIGTDYEQTGNYLGGMSSVTPDGPGYQMRTFNPGLAFGFDLLFDYPGFTSQLKAEFADILNQQIDWYKSYGYERDGDLGNYFIRGLLTGTMFTGYGTDGANSRSTELKTLADSYMQRPFTKLDKKLPGGYGPQGEYANGVASDVLQIFSIYKDLSGQDFLSQLEWTSSIIPATIHGTKPDRATFYDGGDWSDLPATPLTGLVGSFLTYLPNHPMAPYARQLLKDLGQPVPEGTVSDYKTSFPLSYFAPVSGPVYARSGWDTGAVWVSLSAGEIFMDHQHLDQGNITIQRGKDYLLCDGGGYGDFQSEFHNTLLFDDRGAGNLITYPPGQGDWGFDRVGIRACEQAQEYVYGLADLTWAYAQGTEGKNNSVKAAVRSMVYVRPDIVIVHDRAQTFNANVKKYFNCNFSSVPTVSGAITSATLGTSKIFMKTLVPASGTPAISAIANQPIAKSNYREMITGDLNDNFLHVFNATPAAQTAMRATTLVNSATVEGAEVTFADTTWLTTFSKTDSVLSGTVKYTYSSHGPHKDLITDLQKNMQYAVSVSSGGSVVVSNATFSSSKNGTVLFAYTSGDSGTVTLVPTGVPSAVLNPIRQVRMKPMGIHRNQDAITVSFSLETPRPVHVTLFNIKGRIIDQKVSPRMEMGPHEIGIYETNRLPAGTYLVRLVLGTITQTGVFVLTR